MILCSNQWLAFLSANIRNIRSYLSSPYVVIFWPCLQPRRWLTAPFAIISEKAIGEFNVTLRTKDDINGHAIGANAQLPGSQKACSIVTSTQPQKIYEAIRKTAASRGEVLSQAVIVDVRYDAALSPEFKFITQQNAIALSPADQCNAA